MEAVKRYGILTVGSVVLGISDYMFKFQNHFSFGGVSGIAVIMSGLLGGSASTYTFVINMLLKRLCIRGILHIHQIYLSPRMVHAWTELPHHYQ